MRTRQPFRTSLTEATTVLQAFERLDRWGSQPWGEQDVEFWNLITVMRGPDVDTDTMNTEQLDAYHFFKRRVTGTFRTILLPQTAGTRVVQRWGGTERHDLTDEQQEPGWMLKDMILFLRGTDNLPDGYSCWGDYGERNYGYHFMAHIRMATETLSQLVEFPSLWELSGYIW